MFCTTTKCDIDWKKNAVSYQNEWVSTNVWHNQECDWNKCDYKEGLLYITKTD
jgi:hypothetical protein